MKHECSPQLLIGAIGLAAALAGTAAPSGAAILRVASNGLDGATCGPVSQPCRSVSRAIANAADGDKILVGPGRYGDLDRDGILGETGEETGAGCSGNGCVIHVSKPLTVESSDGAGATILDAGATSRDVVRIGSGVIFGSKDKGFTLRGGAHGLITAGGADATKVRYNLATGAAASGFLIRGDQHDLIGNAAIANGGSGFDIGGTGYLVQGNLAAANGFDGYTVTFFTEDMTFRGNLAQGNERDGFSSDGADEVGIIGGSFVANGRFGIALGSGSVDIVKVNIFGNQGDAGSPNCGLRHLGSGSASGNFWGAATGPGANPADASCGGGATAPFAAKAFKVTSPLR